MSSDLVPCTATGVWLELANARVHLTRWPRTDRSTLSYCPTCLGFGTIRVQVTDPITPGWHRIAADQIKVGDRVKAHVTYGIGLSKGDSNDYEGVVTAVQTFGGGALTIVTESWHCSTSPHVAWFVKS